jgi:plastocyanin
MRQGRLSGRRTALLAFLIAALAIPAVPAGASHNSTTIRVGVANDGSSRNNYDDSDITVMAGTGITFNFDNGFHNVVWTSANPGGLANSPGYPGGDAVGSNFNVTPNAPGTYIYFCSIHTNATTALAATDFSAARPAEMYGRIIVQADSTAPVWNAGTATATPVSASQINLTWPTATDNSGAVFYDIREASGATNPGKGASTLVADNATGTTLSRTGLSAGVHYWYWITPVDATGNAGPDLTADATTTSVAASATASSVVQFSVNPTLQISVSPAVLDLGTLSPAAPGTGTATVTVNSNDTWSLSLKSIGRNGVDDAPGDDGFFTDAGGKTIPIARATWDRGGPATALTDANATVVTGQAAGAGLTVPINYRVNLAFSDPAGTNFQTTVLYTVTQP